jgi:hypothetical protein
VGSYLKTANRSSNPLSETLYLIDARPKVNAIGNALGPSQGGYEVGYEKCVIKFLNVENIHVVRESWVLYVSTQSPLTVTGLGD